VEDLDELGLSIIALVVDDAYASDFARRDAGTNTTPRSVRATAEDAGKPRNRW